MGPRRIQLANTIHAVGGGAWGVQLSNTFDCNVYLLISEGQAALVDAGIGMDTTRILTGISEAGISPRQVGYIFLTHCHVDHSGGLAELKRATGAKAVSSECCASAVENHLQDALLEDAMRAQYSGLRHWSFEPAGIDVRVDDGTEFLLGTGTVRAIAAPGHSEDHFVYTWHAADGTNAMFSGDCVFFGGTILLQNVVGCSIQDYAETMHRLARLPDIELLLPGHMLFALRDAAAHVRVSARAFENHRVPANVDIPHEALGLAKPVL